MNRTSSAQRVGFRFPSDVYDNLEKIENHQNGFIQIKTICPKQYHIFFPNDIMKKNFLNIFSNQIKAGIVCTTNSQVYFNTITFDEKYKSSLYLKLEIGTYKTNNLLCFGYCRNATDYIVPTGVTHLISDFFNLDTIDISGPRYIDINKLELDKNFLLHFGYCRNATDYLVPTDITNLICRMGFLGKKAIKQNKKPLDNSNDVFVGYSIQENLG